MSNQPYDIGLFVQLPDDPEALEDDSPQVTLTKSIKREAVEAEKHIRDLVLTNNSKTDAEKIDILVEALALSVSVGKLSRDLMRGILDDDKKPSFEKVKDVEAVANTEWMIGVVSLIGIKVLDIDPSVFG